MKTLLGMAVVAAVLALGGPATVAAAEKVPQVKSQATKSDATDFSAYRRYYRYGYRPYYRPYYPAYYRPYYRPYPYYYARPVYYRPYPYYAPAPFAFGIGFGPFWW
jgi:hypothetical protein